MGGRPSVVSRRSSRLENSVSRPAWCSFKIFHRILPGTLRIKYSPSTNTQSSFL